MSVISCKIKERGTSYNLGLKDSTSISATYLILTDDSTMGGQSVVEGAYLTGPHPLPRRYDSFNHRGDTDNGLYVTSIKLSQPFKGSLQNWQADVTWSTLPPGTQPDDGKEPLDRAAVSWVEFSSVSNIVTEAWNVLEIAPYGDLVEPRPPDTLGPIVNAAKDTMDGVLYEDRRLITLVIRKNYPTYAQAITFNSLFDNTLNNDLFLGAPKACARYDGTTAGQPQYEGNSTYVSTETRITFQREPFYTPIVNQGMRAIDDFGFLENAKDKNKMDVSSPVLLTTDGQQLGVAEGNTIDYRTREFADYAQLLALVT